MAEGRIGPRAVTRWATCYAVWAWMLMSAGLAQSVGFGPNVDVRGTLTASGTLQGLIVPLTPPIGPAPLSASGVVTLDLVSNGSWLDAPSGDRIGWFGEATPSMSATWAEGILTAEGSWASTTRLGLSVSNRSGIVHLGAVPWSSGEMRRLPTILALGASADTPARLGPLGITATAYASPWRVRAGVALVSPGPTVLDPDRATWGAVGSVMRSSVAWTGELHGAVESSGPTLGATGSAFVTNVVLFGEAWWQPGRRTLLALGATGTRGRGTWDAEIVVHRSWVGATPGAPLVRVDAPVGTTVSVRATDSVGPHATIDGGVTATFPTSPVDLGGAGRATAATVRVDAAWSWRAEDGRNLAITPVATWTADGGVLGALTATVRTAF